MDSKASAIEFVDAYHGKQFNFIEPEVCQVSILIDAYIENRKPKSENIFDKVSLEAQECLFEDDLDQGNCPICLENLFDYSH